MEISRNVNPQMELTDWLMCGCGIVRDNNPNYIMCYTPKVQTSHWLMYQHTVMRCNNNNNNKYLLKQ